MSQTSDEITADAPVPSLSAEEKLAELETAIEYTFRDRSLLLRAFTHRSFANEQPEPRPPDNEALEFLGDAVLAFLISAWLLELFPSQAEGTLSKLRANAVSAVALHTHAARLRLGTFLLLNRGEEKTGGRNKVALQVDAFEALIAAIFLDGGIDAARTFVHRQFASSFTGLDPEHLVTADYKTALQERLQSRGLPAPQYVTVETLGPDHRRTFQVEMRVLGQRVASGEGSTIKRAQQEAARVALDEFDATLAKAGMSETALPTEPEMTPSSIGEDLTPESEPLDNGN
jgi:ribonuclease III